MQEHGLAIARQVIRTIKCETVTVEHPCKVRFMSRDPEAAPAAQGYVSVPKLRTEKENARAVVLRELLFAIAALSRAEALAGALGLTGSLRALKAQARRLADNLEGTAAAA
jgi:hypothetical protein